MGRNKIATTPNTPQKKLLYAIVEYYGGPSRLAEIVEIKTGMKLHIQSFINWYIRGSVPLKKVMLLAKVLKVSPYAICFDDYTMLTGKEQSWEDAVNSCKFLSDSIRNKLIKEKLYD